MKAIIRSFDRCSDTDLLLEITRLARSERDATVVLIASLMELDRRRLYLAEGCSSLFTYCTQVLHLSEHAAYGRIKAARTAQSFPVVLDLLVDGAITLTTVTLLAAHLTAENHVAVLAESRHKTKRQLEELAARLAPRPVVPATIRKLPEPKASTVAAPPPIECGPTAVMLTAVVVPPPQRAEVTPLAPERYKMQLTISKETHDKFRRVQDLLRHTVPNGDPAVIVDKALTLLLSELERTKVAATDRPRPPRPASARSRRVPASIRRFVWKRDEGRCAFVGSNGRCTETAPLEFHHVVPYALGGRASRENIQLRCRSHNAHEAEQDFGPWPPMLREHREMYVANSATRSRPSRSDEGPVFVFGDSS